MSELEITISAADLRKKLAIKDGETPAIDYSKVTKDVLEKVIVPKPQDGNDGKDATVDEEKLAKKILKEVIRRLPKPDTMNQYAASGANQIVYQASGTRLSDYVQYLNFGAGLSAAYSNGTILVTASASGSVLSATGTIDDSNTSFTFTQQPSVLVINGGVYQQTGGAITWTWTSATLTATLSSAVGQGGSIFGLL